MAAALVARLDAVAAQKFSPLVAYGSPREVAFSALEGTLPPLGSNNSGTSNVTLADLACEQSADARQRAIMWPRTRCVCVCGVAHASLLVLPPLPRSHASEVCAKRTATWHKPWTDSSHQARQCQQCSLTPPLSCCTVATNDRTTPAPPARAFAPSTASFQTMWPRQSSRGSRYALSSTHTSPVALCNSLRWLSLHPQGQPGYKLLSRTVTAAHARLLAHELGLHVAMKVPEVGLYRLPHNPRRNATTTYLHLHAQRMLCVKQLQQQRQQCQAQQQCQQQQSRGVWKCPTAQSKRVLEALEAHIAFDDTDHLLFSERIDLADIHTVAAVVRPCIHAT